TTTEDGGTAEFTVVLNTQPTADVAIALSSSNTAEGTVSTELLTFTPENWDTAQTVTVTGVADDVVDGDQAYTVALAAATSDDANYEGIDPDDVTVTNQDVVAGSVTVTPTEGLTTTEAGGTATFTVVLDRQPTADVTVPIASSDPSEGTASPASLTFTPDNWDTAQTVTVTGVDDPVDDDDQPYTVQVGPLTSDDELYQGIDPGDVAVTNTDDDTAGITVVPTTGLTTTEEGGTAEFTVVLDSQPTADVAIALSSSNTAEGTVSTELLTFTAENWDTPQTVTVTGVADEVVDGDQAYTVALAAATSDDAKYNELDPTDVAVTNVDVINAPPEPQDDTARAFFNEPLTIPAATLLANDTDPDGDTLTVTAVGNPASGTVQLNGNNVVFTPQTGFTGNASFEYTVSDGTETATATVAVAVNPTPGVTVDPTSGLVTTEAGGTATFTVVLDSPPIANVSIGVSSDDDTEGTVSVNQLVFTPANWDTPQTVTVRGIGDFGRVDRDQTYNVVLDPTVSDDPAFVNIDPADVSVTNRDLDVVPVPLPPRPPTPQNTPPTISDIGDQNAIANSSTGAIAFTVNDAETTANNLTVTATSSNLDLVRNQDIVFGGEGERRTIQLTPVEGQSGSTTVTVTVSDGSLRTTDTFDLDVIPVNLTGEVDTLRGGDGADTFVLGETRPPAAISSATFDNFVTQPSEEFPGQFFGSDNTDVIIGSASDETLLGFQGDDFLNGQGGGDTLFGGQQNDTLVGNQQNDILSGNKDNDNLFGGDGNDTLFGGQQNDTLVGGAGNDELWGDKNNDVLYGVEGEGYSLVNDFEPNVDIIELSGTVADYQLGDLPEGFTNATAIYRITSETAGSDIGLVAILEGVTDVSLEDSNIFSFV
ncbi:Ig-like domain-containing protein, partial [Lyngbya sp. CCY1209]|uniref:Ig-like domain-containing protein n=1 Tax=Lyngbya sp. CCY1209 TaxID=2886103 RepID=UPI002D20BD8C